MSSPTVSLPTNMATEAERDFLASAADEKKENDPSSERRPPIPVTILSGFLGSGKTTLLKHILESSDHKMKVAVIVNDMAELNIDAAMVQQSQVVQAEREVISLQNGCICCTLRGDLIREIARIKSSDAEFDYVLIESTGIAEPMQVAQAFVFDPDTAQLATSEEDMMWTQAKLDTLVTVVDAHMFLPMMTTLQRFSDKFEDGLDRSTPEGEVEGKKSISNLLVEQVEFADVILLNKTDLVDSEEQLEKTKQLIRSLNPNAKLFNTKFSKIDLKQILNTGTFDIIKAGTSAGWIQEIRNIKQDVGKEVHGEADEYGVNSFVYRARSPFHPQRIARWVDSILYLAGQWADLPEDLHKAFETDPKYDHMLEEYGNILRAKGFCWLAEHDSFIIAFAQSGRIGSLSGLMPWYTTIPQDQWPAEEGSDDYEVITSKFQEPHGDRRQELVFIGCDLKVDNIRKALDKCLLTEQELKGYTFYSDRSSLGK